jgi:putative aldouronate transport system substrate-binding protein
MVRIYEQNLFVSLQMYICKNNFRRNYFMRIQKVAVLILVVLMGLAMAACSREGGQQSVQQSQTGQGGLSGITPVKATWPLTQTKQTFSIYAQISGATVENVETNAFTSWFEDKTNVHIDWRVVTSGAGQQIPLMIAANDLPDAFFGNLSDTQIQTYALLDKVLVPLTESIYRYAPNVRKMLDESESARQYSWLPDGEIYCLLRIVDTYNERVTKRAWVYEPWLRLLDIQLPNTTQDFYNMLTRFKNEIPGRIGVRDIVPFAGALLNNPANNEPESYILNSFIYYDRGNFLEVQPNGKIAFTANTEEYREGLRYLNRLYSEGLLSSETWTQNRNGLLAMTEGGPQNVLGVAAAMYWGHFTTENGPLGRDMEFISIPPLLGPGGVRNAYDRGMLSNNGRLAVTTACKNVDLLVQWCDWFFDAEAMMESGYSANYGPEGTGWVRARPGELDMNGVQAKYRYLRAIDGKQNDNWFQIMPYYESAAYIQSIVNDQMNRKEAFGGAETAVKYMPYSAFNKMVPFMYAPLESMDEITRLREALANSTTGEVSTFRDRFITGQLNLDRDWAQYINTLNRVGVERYVQLYQQMYDDFLRLQSQNR